MKLLCSLLVFLFFTASYAQDYKVVKVYTGGPEDIIKLVSGRVLSDNFFPSKDNSVIAVLSSAELFNASTLGFRYEVLIDDWFKYYNSLPELTEQEKSSFLMESAGKFGVTGFGFGSMGGFYTYEEIGKNLDSMHARYPNLITEKVSIGKTHQNRDIWAVKISDNPQDDEGEPGVLIDGLMHAREPAGMASVMYYMYYLLENYGTNPEATYLVNNRAIYCIPIVNPDGYEFNRQSNPNGGGMWRKNRRFNNDGSYGVDLNRNFGYKWGIDNIGSSPTPSDDAYRGPAAFSEPEILAIKNYTLGKNVKTYINFHTWQNAILYPWGYANAFTPDSATFREYAVEMSKWNGYVYGNSYSILGYYSNGTARDWMYGEQTIKGKAFSYTFEVGNSSDYFWAPQNRIFPLAQGNLRPNLFNTWVAGEYVSPVQITYDHSYFNPGDTVNMNFKLKNRGLSSAYNLKAEVIPLGSYITASGENFLLDSLQARAVSVSNCRLKFAISPEAPAEEKVKLILRVSTGTTVMSQDTLSLTIGTPRFVFRDSTSNPALLWTVASTVAHKWEATTSAYYSAPDCFTDSKSGNYLPSATVTMTLTGTIDLAGIQKPYLTFWTKYEIENNYDYGQVEVSTNSGSTWTPLAGAYTNMASGSFQPAGQPLYDGAQLSWVKEEISLAQFSGKQIKLRFKFRSDNAIHKDGWYIDDIGVFYFGAVPVELLSFTASHSKSEVTLNWKTATETNNRGFEVERSQDKLHFSKIGFVPGNGTVTEPGEYSFTDKPGVKGKFYYRLKQNDYDGTFKYYGPLEIQTAPAAEFALEQNYPNPFNPVTTIGFSLPGTMKVTLKIYDVLGREAATLINSTMDAGRHEVTFDASSFSSGVYFCRLRAGENMITRKMILNK